MPVSIRDIHFLIHEVGLQITRVAAIDLQVVNGQMLEARERAQTTAKIVKRELTADAVQHLNKALCMLHICKNGRLCNLEAYR